jgi:predicted kinase
MKRVYILRGVSGSGKSTFIKKLPKNRVVHSTDKFFYKGGKYRFDLKKLPLFHEKNFKEYQKSLKKGKRVVVVDNTNLLCEHVKPYIDEARKYGYKIVLVDFLPKRREYHYKRNTHNIPLKAIDLQIKNYHKCKNKIENDRLIHLF